MNQTSTAAVSYQISTETGQIGTINDMVYNYIKLHQPCSNKDLELGLCKSNTQISCARWHLLQDGKIIVRGHKLNESTNRPAETVVINPAPEIIFHKVTSAEKLEKIKELCEKSGWTYGLAEEILKIIG